METFQADGQPGWLLAVLIRSPLNARSDPQQSATEQTNQKYLRAPNSVLPYFCHAQARFISNSGSHYFAGSEPNFSISGMPVRSSVCYQVHPIAYLLLTFHLSIMYSYYHRAIQLYSFLQDPSSQRPDSLLNGGRGCNSTFWKNGSSGLSWYIIFDLGMFSQGYIKLWVCTLYSFINNYYTTDLGHVITDTIEHTTLHNIYQKTMFDLRDLAKTLSSRPIK